MANSKPLLPQPLRLPRPFGVVGAGAFAIEDGRRR